MLASLVLDDRRSRQPWAGKARRTRSDGGHPLPTVLGTDDIVTQLVPYGGLKDIRIQGRSTGRNFVRVNEPRRTAARRRSRSRTL
jgi:hypothetical protein